MMAMLKAVLNTRVTGAMAVVVVLLAGCSQSTAPAASDAAVAKPAGPPPLVSAKTAYGPMYKSAVAWSSDAVMLHIAAKEVPGFKNEAGKAAMWEATFASPSLHKYRVDTYAIATVLPDIHRGASAGLPLPWGGQTRDAMPIDLSSFNTDSDAAYTAAATDATEWLTKNPDKKLSAMELGNVFKFHALVWYVMWGDEKTGYISYVDASTGKTLKSK
jgi:hypothetical protein